MVITSNDLRNVSRISSDYHPVELEFMSAAKEQLRERLLFFLEHLEYSGSLGLSGSMPSFDYYALDFLDFAEMNLRRTSEVSQTREQENELISCVSNLKRALDC